jgi:hypothetical protein
MVTFLVSTLQAQTTFQQSTRWTAQRSSRMGKALFLFIFYHSIVLLTPHPNLLFLFLFLPSAAPSSPGTRLKRAGASTTPPAYSPGKVGGAHPLPMRRGIGEAVDTKLVANAHAVYFYIFSLYNPLTRAIRLYAPSHKTAWRARRRGIRQRLRFARGSLQRGRHRRATSP